MEEAAALEDGDGGAEHAFEREFERAAFNVFMEAARDDDDFEKVAAAWDGDDSEDEAGGDDLLYEAYMQGVMGGD